MAIYSLDFINFWGFVRKKLQVIKKKLFIIQSISN